MVIYAIPSKQLHVFTAKSYRTIQSGARQWCFAFYCSLFVSFFTLLTFHILIANCWLIHIQMNGRKSKWTHSAVRFFLFFHIFSVIAHWVNRRKNDWTSHFDRIIHSDVCHVSQATHCRTFCAYGIFSRAKNSQKSSIDWNLFLHIENAMIAHIVVADYREITQNNSFCLNRWPIECPVY